MQIYDSDKIESLLKPLGYQVTNSPENANLVILNTCHIREKAEQKVFSELGRLKAHKKANEQQGEDYIIAVGGCVAQAEGEEIIRQAPYVSIVFGPQNYHELPELLTKIHRENGRSVNTEFPVESKFDYLPEPETTKASAFLTIQEGCDKFCTFCVVPYTRGAEYSRPVKDIIKEAKKLAELGAKEITLLGQNVSAYHGEAPQVTESQKEWRLGQLIEEVAKIDQIKRIRYTTSHPRDMDDHLLSTHGTVEKLMPYLHLPVQSGSDKVLDIMNRKHTIKTYREIIAKLKSYRPDILISSDFITGYPGETHEDHQSTLEIIQDCIDTGFSFKYSPRTGTPASVKEQVPEEVKLSRLYDVQAALRTKQLLSHQALANRVVPVLFEKKGKAANQIIGKTPYLQSVITRGTEDLIGNIVNVHIQNAYQNSLEGEIVYNV